MAGNTSTSGQQPRREFDPIVDELQTQMLKQLSSLTVAAGVRQRRPWLNLFMARMSLWATKFAVDFAFGALTACLAIIGAAILVLSWPWSAPSGGPAFVEVTVGAATATVFSSVIFSALSLPHSTAAEIAPGFTSEVVTRKSPWLTGLALVGLAVFLFVISAYSPDREAAIAAGALTSAGFSATWLVSRRLMESADLLDVTQRQAAHLRKNFWRADRYHRRVVKAMLKPEAQTQRNVDLAANDQSLAYLSGFLRQIRTGVTASLSSGRPQLVPTYWAEMLTLFIEYAEKSGGRVGSNMGPMSVVFSTLQEIVREGHEKKGEYDLSAQSCVVDVTRLAAVNVDDSNYAALRSYLIGCLRDCMHIVWESQTSVVPANLAQTYARCAAEFADARAFSDSHKTLDDLGRLSLLAYGEGKKHIAVVGCESLIGTLPRLLGVDSSRARIGLTRTLFTSLKPFADLRITRQLDFYEPTTLVAPGIAIGQKGLQQAIWEVPNDVETLQTLSAEAASWLGPILQRYSSADPENLFSDVLHDGLAVTLSFSQRLAASPLRNDWPSVYSRLAVDWAQGTEAVRVRERLIEPDAAEMVWSIGLLCAYAADDPDIMRSHAKAILEVLRPLDGLNLGEFARSFILGLLVIEGKPWANVESEVSRLDVDTYGAGLHEHIPGYGLAPSINLNRAEYDPATVGAANAWALRTFPRFRGPGECSQTPERG